MQEPRWVLGTPRQPVSICRADGAHGHHHRERPAAARPGPERLRRRQALGQGVGFLPWGTRLSRRTCSLAGNSARSTSIRRLSGIPSYVRAFGGPPPRIRRFSAIPDYTGLVNPSAHNDAGMRAGGWHIPANRVSSRAEGPGIATCLVSARMRSWVVRGVTGRCLVSRSRRMPSIRGRPPISAAVQCGSRWPSETQVGGPTRRENRSGRTHSRNGYAVRRGASRPPGLRTRKGFRREAFPAGEMKNALHCQHGASETLVREGRFTGIRTEPSLACCRVGSGGDRGLSASWRASMLRPTGFIFRRPFTSRLMTVPPNPQPASVRSVRQEDICAPVTKLVRASAARAKSSGELVGFAGVGPVTPMHMSAEGLHDRQLIFG
jgi:hypothetical protein